MVWHWPGGSFPPTLDSPDLMMVDGSSPGAVGGFYAQRDFDTIFIASTKATEVSYMPMSVTTTNIEGDEKLLPGGLPQKSPNTPEFKERMKKYKNEYKENVKHVEGFKVNPNDVTCSVQVEEEHGLMWTLGDFPSACSISPVFPANGWEFEIPEGSKEFIALMGYGRVTRY